MKTYTDVKKEILEESKNVGSLAFHCTHEWDTSKENGIWCIDCQQWVLTVGKGER